VRWKGPAFTPFRDHPLVSTLEAPFGIMSKLIVITSPDPEEDRTGLFDDNLTWRAKGLLWYCLGRRSREPLDLQQLMDVGMEGRDAVYGMLKELRERHYLYRASFQLDGKMFEWVYVLLSAPRDLSPEGVKRRIQMYMEASEKAPLFSSTEVQTNGNNIPLPASFPTIPPESQSLSLPSSPPEKKEETKREKESEIKKEREKEKKEKTPPLQPTHTLCDHGKSDGLVMVNMPTKKDDRVNYYLPYAERLARVIQRHKRMKYTSHQIRSWANEVRRLVEQHDISEDRIKAALIWYRDNAGRPYVPVIESGAALREKFIRLEEAMARDGGGRTPANTIQHPLEFEQLCSAYPNKNRLQAAQKSFEREYSNLPGIDQLVHIVEVHSRQDTWRKDNGKFVPLLVNWLDEGRWEDPIEGTEGLLNDNSETKVRVGR